MDGRFQSKQLVRRAFPYSTITHHHVQAIMIKAIELGLMKQA